MDPAILSYKYNDLRQVAKDLGINNFGEYSGMPTRDQLIESIKSYYDNDCKPVVKKKTKKAAKEVEQPEDTARDKSTTRLTRRTTRIAAEITNDIANQQPETQNTAPAKEEESQQALKKKKRTKKADKENDSNQENAKVDTIEPVASTTAKTSKKTKSKKAEATTQEVAVEETKKETKTTKKKTKQAEVEQSASTSEVVSTAKTNQEVQSTSDNEKSKTKKTRTKPSSSTTKTKKTSKKETNQKVAVNSNDIIYDTNTNQSDEFQLKLDEDDDSQSRQVSQQQQPEIVVEQVEQSKPEDQNSSLITNDENETQDNQAQDLNVTKDVLNRTFDKIESESVSTSGRLVSANIKPFYIEEANNKQEINQTENPVSCNSFYSNNNVQPQQEQQTSEENKPKGGARIVRPKQKVAVKVDSEKEEAKKVVVELVQREAGPRIVKPPEAANEDVKRKNNTDNSTSTKKSKETKKAPDFKAIHEKNFEKLESVSEQQQRLAQRHKLLTSAAKTPSQEAKSRLPTSATVSNDLNRADTKSITTNNNFTPKVVKTKSSYSVMSSAQKPTNIPRILTNATKEAAKKPFEPKTPNANEERKQTMTKTPTSLMKPKTSVLMQSATKKPSFAFSHEHQHLNQINFSSGCAFNAGPSTNSLLATSSFQRRKSFDLNASLARPLNYKRHIGKLKPIEPSKQGSNHLKPVNMNETITKTTTTTSGSAHLKAAADTKRSTLLKQRELFKQSRTSCNEVEQDENTIAKENTNKTNEQLKVKRKKKFDEKRNLNENQTAAAVH